jgi:hypothetical protein
LFRWQARRMMRSASSILFITTSHRGDSGSRWIRNKARKWRNVVIIWKCFDCVDFLCITSNELPVFAPMTWKYRQLRPTTHSQAPMVPLNSNKSVVNLDCYYTWSKEPTNERYLTPVISMHLE